MREGSRGVAGLHWASCSAYSTVLEVPSRNVPGIFAFREREEDQGVAGVGTKGWWAFVLPTTNEASDGQWYTLSGVP